MVLKDHLLKISLLVAGAFIAAYGMVVRSVQVASIGGIVFVFAIGQLMTYFGHKKSQCDYCQQIHE